MKRARMILCCLAACVATLTASARDADAFCGFYVAGADAKLFNDATQVVMMRKGTRTVLSMQNSYKGPPSDFAMVVPVPVVLQKENVKTLPSEIFARVDSLGAPRLVEYWERDPCNQDEYKLASTTGVRGGAMPTKRRKGKGSGDLGVTVEAQFKVGEYDIVILSARDSGGLETWLKRERYKIPAGAEPYLRPYVQSGSKFFVAKVDIKKVKFEGNMAMLSPLRFHYDSKQFSLPIRLGMMNSEGTQDLIVNILAPGQRYELANRPNVTIPTNLDLRVEAKGRFGEFYTALFDRTLEKSPNAAVTEYAWDASTCDPCPLPALRPNELHTLGGDVINGEVGQGAPMVKPGKGRPARVRRRRMPRQRFVLTRLHLRYKSDASAEDLVFKEAASIAGGREWRDGSGKLEESSKPHPRNMFQARYAIRHAWTGKIECKNPVRGRWGGPPAGVAGSQKPAAATRLAFAKRGAKLASLVAQDVPEIGLSAAGGPATEPTPAPAATNDKKPADKPATPKEPAKKEESKGCSTSGGSGGVALVVLLALLGFRRRRR